MTRYPPIVRFRNPKPREVTLRVRNLGVAPRVGETGGGLRATAKISGSFV